MCDRRVQRGFERDGVAPRLAEQQATLDGGEECEGERARVRQGRCPRSSAMRPGVWLERVRRSTMSCGFGSS